MQMGIYNGGMGMVNIALTNTPLSSAGLLTSALVCWHRDTQKYEEGGGDLLPLLLALSNFPPHLVLEISRNLYILGVVDG